MEVMKSVSEPILRCSEMESSLIIENNSLSHCCKNGLWGYDAKICDFNGGRFPLDRYNRSFRDVVLQNMAHTGPCKGCPGLKYGPPNIWSKELAEIDIIPTNKCQLRCTYCNKSNIISQHSTDGQNKDFFIVPLLEDLVLYSMIKKDALAVLGGGEPTLYEYFDDTVAFCLDNNIRLHVLTNAVIASESIVNLLKSGGTIMVDTDSGTPETYKIVKGADCHERVWENIKKYKEAGNVLLKYILTADNLSEHEISAFLEKCMWAGVTDIIISSQIKLHQPIHHQQDLRDEYLDSATLFYDLARSKNLNVGFNYFTDAEIAIIKNMTTSSSADE
jgi:molybdenum cofactor biosynthesis enzyme MoaA